MCRAKIYFKIFSENSNVGSHLPSLSSTLNLKLYKVSVNSKMANRVRTTLYSFKASGPNSIPMLVLKNYEPAFSYELTVLFNMCLKKSCFLKF